MNKKPGLLFAVSVLAFIILAVSFGFNYGGGEVVHLRAGVNPDTVLYVCPMKDSTWLSISNSLKSMINYIYGFFGFAVIVLLFSWGWALYQNLLKDKFSADAYKNSWELTKIVFWLAVVTSVLVLTPNHFRTVSVKGSNADWVLCENTSTGAKAVNAGKVTLK